MAGPRSCRPVVHGQSDVWLEGIKPKRGRGSSDAGICEHRVHSGWSCANAKPPQILNRRRVVGPGRNARIRPVVTRVGGCLHRSHRGGRAIWVLPGSPSHVVETPLVDLIELLGRPGPTTSQISRGIVETGRIPYMVEQVIACNPIGVV